jgi:hypothetical protein
VLRTLALVLLVGLLAGSSAANLALLQQVQSTTDEANRLRVRAVNAEATSTSLGSRVDALEARVQQIQPAGDSASGQTAAAQIEQIAQQVETVRGLRRGAEVPVQFMDQAALTQYIRQSYERDYLPAERESDQKLLVTLGMLRPEENLFQIGQAIVADQPLALYSPDDRTLHVSGAATQALPPAVQVTVAHEMARVLLDRAYDLSRLQPKHSANNDRAAALQALVEGDASLTQRMWMQQNVTPPVQASLPQPDTHLIDDAPGIIHADALFAPVAGLRFVEQLYQQTGSFASVDAAFKSPPTSTAQILHPEKFLGHGQSIEVDLPDPSAALGAGWRRIDTNVLGEFDLFNLLAQDGDGTQAAASVSGWAGDRWELLEQNGRQAVALRTAWDSEDSAKAFFSAYAAGLKVRFVSARTEVDAPVRLAQTAPNAATELRLAGQEVLAVIAFDRPSAEAIVSLIGR